MATDTDTTGYRTELVNLAAKMADALTGSVAGNEERGRAWAGRFRIYYRHLAASVEFSKHHAGDGSAWGTIAEETDNSFSAK